MNKAPERIWLFYLKAETASMPDLIEWKFVSTHPGDIEYIHADLAETELAEQKRYAENELQNSRHLRRLLAAAEKREAKLEQALVRIQQWATAYPLDIFPEPDFAEVRKALKERGISLDAVSASNMRHVIGGVSEIVAEALK